MNKPQETPAETAQRARQLITNLIPLSTAGGRTVSRQDEIKIESLFELLQMFAANELSDRAALVEELQRHLFSMSNSHLSSYDNWKKKLQGKPAGGAAEVTDAAN